LTRRGIDADKNLSGDEKFEWSISSWRNKDERDYTWFNCHVFSLRVNRDPEIIHWLVTKPRYCFRVWFAPQILLHGRMGAQLAECHSNKDLYWVHRGKPKRAIYRRTSGRYTALWQLRLGLRDFGKDCHIGRQSHVVCYITFDRRLQGIYVGTTWQKNCITNKLQNYKCVTYIIKL